MATVLTTTDLAATLETTPRTLRKFLRSDASGIDGVGKGARYTIEAKQVRSLRSRFTKWVAAQEAAKNEREAAAEAPEVTDETPADDAE